MKFSLIKSVQGLDDFGHPIGVTYKGEETFQSFIGGLCTIILKFLTSLIILKSISEVIYMEEPQIDSY